MTETINNLNMNTQANAVARESQLRSKATEFVNRVFYGTLLREFRNSQSETVLDGGPGSMTFVRQLDAEIISRISKKGDSPLTEALIKQLSNRAADKQERGINIHNVYQEAMLPDLQLDGVKRVTNRLTRQF